MELFAVPVANKFLLHAPLHHLTALVNRSALISISDHLQRDADLPPVLRSIVEPLQYQPTTPAVRTGALQNPLFLGIIPTRGCNMACLYCDFAAPKQNSSVMALSTARRAVVAYFDLLEQASHRHAEVHFFGGEPFFAEQVVHFTVEFAAQLAAERNMQVRFEATSNGLYNAKRCRWIAEHFDTLVLSLDGTADIQDRYRPGINHRPTSPIVIRNAKIFSEGPVELIIRACVTAETVRRMPEIARWIGDEFRPSTVCFETLSLSHTAQPLTFGPPDPYEFARNFDLAAGVLNDYGIDTVLSTANLQSPRISFCPVGNDALIVDPEGAVDACYLLQKDWERSGLDMRLGWLANERFDVSAEAVRRVRGLTDLDHKPLCANCLCRYYCAGGCHVNHDTSAPAGHYDHHCLHTRIVTITRLLRKLGQAALAQQWLDDRQALETTALHSNDRLLEQEVVLQ